MVLSGISTFVSASLITTVLVHCIAATVTCKPGWTPFNDYCYLVNNYGYVPPHGRGGWINADYDCKKTIRGASQRNLLLAEPNMANLTAILKSQVNYIVHGRPAIVYLGAGLFNYDGPTWTTGYDPVTIRNCTDSDIYVLFPGDCGLLVYPWDYSFNYCMAYVECDVFFNAAQYISICQYIPPKVECDDLNWKLGPDGETCYKFNPKPPKQQTWDYILCDTLLNNTATEISGTLAVINTPATLMWASPYIQAQLGGGMVGLGSEVGATGQGIGAFRWINNGQRIQRHLPLNLIPDPSNDCGSVIFFGTSKQLPLGFKMNYIKCNISSIEPWIIQKQPGKYPVIDKKVWDYIVSEKKPKICRQLRNCANTPTDCLNNSCVEVRCPTLQTSTAAGSKCVCMYMFN